MAVLLEGGDKSPWLSAAGVYNAPKAAQVLINALSLTKPALVNGFCISFSFTGAFLFFLGTPVRSCRDVPVAERSLVCEPCSPDALSPVSFIALVLPTSHLFDQRGP
jgi:hypothetical protein